MVNILSSFSTALLISLSNKFISNRGPRGKSKGRKYNMQLTCSVEHVMQLTLWTINDVTRRNRPIIFSWINQRVVAVQNKHYSLYQNYATQKQPIGQLILNVVLHNVDEQFRLAGIRYQHTIMSCCHGNLLESNSICFLSASAGPKIDPESNILKYDHEVGQWYSDINECTVIWIWACHPSWGWMMTAQCLAPDAQVGQCLFPCLVWPCFKR